MDSLTVVQGRVGELKVVCKYEGIRCDSDVTMRQIAPAKKYITTWDRISADGVVEYTPLFPTGKRTMSIQFMYDKSSGSADDGWTVKSLDLIIEQAILSATGWENKMFYDNGEHQPTPMGLKDQVGDIDIAPLYMMQEYFTIESVNKILSIDTNDENNTLDIYATWWGVDSIPEPGDPPLDDILRVTYYGEVLDIPVKIMPQPIMKGLWRGEGLVTHLNDTIDLDFQITDVNGNVLNAGITDVQINAQGDSKIQFLNNYSELKIVNNEIYESNAVLKALGKVTIEGVPWSFSLTWFFKVASGYSLGTPVSTIEVTNGDSGAITLDTLFNGVANTSKYSIDISGVNTNGILNMGAVTVVSNKFNIAFTGAAVGSTTFNVLVKSADKTIPVATIPVTVNCAAPITSLTATPSSRNVSAGTRGNLTLTLTDNNGSIVNGATFNSKTETTSADYVLESTVLPSASGNNDGKYSLSYDSGIRGGGTFKVVYKVTYKGKVYDVDIGNITVASQTPTFVFTPTSIQAGKTTSVMFLAQAKKAGVGNTTLSGKLIINGGASITPTVDNNNNSGSHSISMATNSTKETYTLGFNFIDESGALWSSSVNITKT